MNTISSVSSIKKVNSVPSLSIHKSFTYNGYDYYIFPTGISSFTCKAVGNVDFIIVGGGGAGGDSVGGGGGAGGVAYGSTVLYGGQTYKVMVGDGGTAGYYNNIVNNGDSSSIIGEGVNITAYGGGYGAGGTSGYAYNLQNLIFYFPFNTNFTDDISGITLNELSNNPTPTINTSVQRIGTGCLDCHLGAYIGTYLNFELLYTFTLSCWIKLTVLPSSSNAQTYITVGSLLLNNTTTGLTSSIQFWAGSYCQTIITKPVLDKWYNIVLTSYLYNRWDGYVNGVKIFSNIQMSSPIQGNIPIKFGGASKTTNLSYIYIDDFRLYGFTFDQNQVKSIYAGNSVLNYPVASGGGGTGAAIRNGGAVNKVGFGGIAGQSVSDLSYGNVGYNGGNALTGYTPINGAGGGGAGGAGIDGEVSLIGNGGIGISSSILTWLPNLNATGYMSNISPSWVNSTSSGTYIAGGGAGGGLYGGYGIRGIGGGGGIYNGTTQLDGIAYTGGGGCAGSSGGCGLVVIRSLSSNTPNLQSFKHTLDLDPYLLLYFTFETSDYSGNIVYNKAPNSNSNFNGTLINGASISSTDCVVGTSSLQLNSTFSHYLQIDNLKTGNNGLTFAFWFKSNSSGTYAKLFDFGKKSQYNFENINFMVNNSGYGTAGIQVYNGNNLQQFLNPISSTLNPYFVPYLNNINCNNNVWNHYAVTFTYAPYKSATSLAKIYVNGLVAGVLRTSYYPKDFYRNYSYIGKSNNTSDPYFNGYIDDFRIYNRVLLSSEIQTLQYMKIVDKNYYIIDQLSKTIQSSILYNNNQLSAGLYGLVLLYSEYTGPVLTIRKSSDLSSSSLQNFYADVYGTIGVYYLGTGISMNTWLNGNTPYIVQWWDQTGNQNHATQTNISYQPIFDISNNTIVFNSGSYFNLPNGSYPYGNSDYTYTFKSSITNNGSILGGGDKGTSTMNSFGKL